ncbi:SpaA isopeptide-forming pilin-related protein, partial [Porcincola sp. LCP21S3_C12]|uniref:SpaA isopeptide-forming pilin-related protein n=1 Tax=Porcincola sp. LCP21S3_C12 TaxID=3438798 RepID=UPI003F964FFA
KYVDTKKTYKITEKAGDDKTVAYDKDEYDVTVTLHDDGNGNIEVKYDKAPDGASFTNTYGAKGTITFGGMKTLENRELKEGEFTFVLTKPDGTTETVTNKSDGSFKFPTINYTLADLDKKDDKYVDTKKTYKITEKAGDDKTVAYDKDEYDVTVTLHDDGNGNIEVKYDKAPDGASFTNTYGAKGTITFGGMKTLENRELKEGEFTFVLTKPDGTTETVTNKSDGSFKFPTIDYTLADLDKKDDKYVDTKKTYKITELAGADNTVVYDSSEYEVTVTLHDDGKGNIEVTCDKAPDGVTFTNTATLVKVSKVDATNSKELAGATIQILDESGKVVAEWVSTTQAHEVVGLETGKTYTLHETVAPDGYDLAEQDTTFSINKDGTVNAGTTKSVNGVLLVEDQAKKNVLAFDKVSMFGMSMVGAKMAVIRLDAGGETVKDTWTTNGKAHQVEGISDGSYVLRELAAPYGFTLAPDVAFTVRDGKAALKQAGNGRLSTAGAVQVVVMTDATQLGVRDQRFAKVDEQGRFMPGAELQITTEEGNVIAVWTTDGAEHTERLIGGNYILAETKAPAGYQVADPIRFTVNEKGFITSIDGKSVSGSTDAVVTMTDKKIAAETETEKVKKQEAKGVKTGDDTPILPMTMALAVSALAVLLILSNKRKKEKQ